MVIIIMDVAVTVDNTMSVVNDNCIDVASVANDSCA